MPVGGGPPARRPRCELRSARRLEARPGPAATHGHRSPVLRRPSHRRVRLMALLVAPRVFGRRGACPPARRPRRELRSARRLEARPGPAGHSAASNRACACPPWPCRRPRAPQSHPYCPAGHAAASNRACLCVPWPCCRPRAPQPHPYCPVGPAAASGWGVPGTWCSSAVSHVIPLRMFLVLKWDRWYSAVFELLVNEVLGELRATFRGGHSAVPGSFACNSP